MTVCALFANVENPFLDTRRAFREAVATVVHAERLGFDQAWLTEHHFNRYSLSAALMPLLAHLAGRTHRIGLGAAAALLPLHDPIRMAEDIATVDALAEGRLLLGVGRSGPFPDQFRHFHVAPEESRARLFEAVDLIGQALAREALDFAGEFYRYDNLSVFPRPIRRKLPVWIASLSAASTGPAARRGYGIMAPSAAPMERIVAAQSAFLADGGGDCPPIVVARYFHCHRDGRRARGEALPFIREFAQRMGIGPASSGIADDELLARAVVGDPAECLAQCDRIGAALGRHVLLLKPASLDPEATRQALGLFAEEVRPHLRPTPAATRRSSPEGALP